MSNDRVSKSWVFTLNNYTDQELKDCLHYATDADFRRMAVGAEVGDNGTPHFQGAVIFTRAKRLSGVRRLFHRAHWEPMRGNWKQAREYALKDVTDENPAIVDKDDSQQGSRTDLNEIKRAIMDGCDERELWENFFPQMVRYHRGIIKGKTMLKPLETKREYYATDFNIAPIKWGRRAMSCIIYGPSNTGKTQYALSNFNNPLFVTHMDTLGEFIPGVHDGIIFDDMEFNHLPRTAQIQLVDAAQGRHVHIRYARAWIPAGTRKIFTTNQEHGAIFTIDDKAIRRRLLMLEVTERLFDVDSDGGDTEEDPIQTWDDFLSDPEQ